MPGFGRKGVDGDAVGNVPGAQPDDGLSPQARAFIAAERARRAAEPLSDPPPTSAVDSALEYAPSQGKTSKSMVMAYVLWWFASPLGAHRFYLEAHSSAIAMAGLFVCSILMLFLVPLLGVLMLCGFFGWHLLDAVLIPGLHRKCKVVQPSDDLAAVFA